MLNKILESISYLTKKFIRDNIDINHSYRALKWGGGWKKSLYQDQSTM
ncbi:Hypothetical protein SCC1_1680 [Pectobacterium versatile]|nr:Hypothetical protein SCC1_1680 [Pectobacterium versatile]